MSRNGDDGSPGRPRPPSLREVKKQAPQKTVDDFWSAFTTKYPGKVHNILPKNPYARSKAANEPKGTVYGHGTHESYEDAKAECIASVEKIANECRRVNMRYRDPHFDVEWDLKSKKRDCLDGLLLYPDAGKPRSVKRVHQIFENPQFYVDGATAGDVRQGRAGDCWFLAALGALGNKKDLIEKVCVWQDEAVGVYGFVFYRDGDWISTVIDDKLYLSVPDWDESLYEKVQWLQIPNRQDAEEEYRKVYQTGSRALYFAQCNTENETWLPLLEKAYAKAHGDYYAIDGGFTGEAIEDLTGGVTTEIFTSDILDIDQFWKEELLKVNDEFLFGCATGRFDDWQGGGQLTDRKGIQSGHAYSIMEAREVRGERLLKVRNPWGETEWSGPWSDGSEQWTPEWMELLDHKFGDDGVFWISYKDLLRKYQFFDRTRLFGREWSVTQQWTSVDVPWSADYNSTMFSFTLTKGTPIVIVLSQLDDRYWDGLQGQYNFSLHFRISKDGEDDYIVRSHGNYSMTRSVSTELDLDAGCYTVRMRITATRYQKRPTVEEVIRMNCKTRQEKLLQIGMSYDLAHAKGLIQETEEEKKRKVEEEAKDKTAAKTKAREEAKKRKYQEWLRHKKLVERGRREKERINAHRKKKEEQKRSEGPPTQEAKGTKNTTELESSAIRDGAYPGLQGQRNVEPAWVAAKENGAQTPGSDSENPRDSLVSPVSSTKIAFNAGQANEDDVPAIDKETPLSNREVENVNGDFVPTAQADVATPDRVKTDSVPNALDTQAKMPHSTEQLDQEPISKDPFLPAVKINGEDAADQVIPTPPPSPGFLDRRSEASEPETVITYVSSLDTDLDERFFDDDIREDGFRDGSIIIAEAGPESEDDDLEEYSSDPWNAVCVVGLRLYTKEGEASVEVIRPVESDDKDEKEETPLDVDDPMRSMSDEPVTPSSPLKKQVGISEGIAERLARTVPKPTSMFKRSSVLPAGRKIP